MNVTYVFTDHVGGESVVRRLVDNGFDTEADALSMYEGIEQGQADNEILDAYSIVEDGANPDKVAVYQDQFDFDRRVLALVMTLDNANTFIGTIAFFQALEIRGGANAGQRATYLDVPLAEYQLVETRFNQIMGTATVLEDDQGRVWDDIPGGWE